MKPEHFLLNHSVFTRDELAEVLRGLGRAESSVDSNIARWIRQGRILRVKRGLFLRNDDEDGGGGLQLDFVALASRMAPDALLAYHTALEVHGFAQSVFERLTFATWTKTKPMRFRGREFVPVRPRAPLRDWGAGAVSVERVDRAGIEVRVTSIERTLVDALDRPDLCGGAEEVWRSLENISAVDPGPLEEYVKLIDSATLAAKVGFFLEQHREELVIPSVLIKRLLAMRPQAPVHLDRKARGKLVKSWSLIVPTGLQPEALGDEP